jgi:hypothetical protein
VLEESVAPPTGSALVNSCRMDEYRLFGGFVTVVSHAEKEKAEVKA